VISVQNHRRIGNESAIGIALRTLSRCRAALEMASHMFKSTATVLQVDVLPHTRNYTSERNGPSPLFTASCSIERSWSRIASTSRHDAPDREYSGTCSDARCQCKNAIVSTDDTACTVEASVATLSEVQLFNEQRTNDQRLREYSAGQITIQRSEGSPATRQHPRNDNCHDIEEGMISSGSPVI
jgi:hypothetical protein